MSTIMMARLYPLRIVAGMLAVLVALSGCAQRVPEVAPSSGVYAAPDGVKFSVRVTPAKFALGEAVSLEASFFNGSRDAFERKFTTGCMWDYEIAAENGRVVGPSRVCEAVEGELRLEPGELRMIMREWGGNDAYFGASESLSPGRYSVTAGFIDENMRVIPMAEPVWIEIVAPRKRG